MITTTRDTCQYIGPGADYTRLQPTCAHTSLAGKSYCAEHYALVYQVGTGVRRKKDTRRANTLREIISDLNDVYAELLDEGEIEES